MFSLEECSKNGKDRKRRPVEKKNFFLKRIDFIYSNHDLQRRLPPRGPPDTDVTSYDVQSYEVERYEVKA